MSTVTIAEEISKLFVTTYKDMLHPISLISKNGDHAFIDSSDIGFNYDSIIKNFVKSKEYKKYYGGDVSTPCTPDMLEFVGRKIVFTEFKESRIHSSEKRLSLKVKLFEGLRILWIIIHVNKLSYSFRDLLDYCLENLEYNIVCPEKSNKRVFGKEDVPDASLQYFRAYTDHHALKKYKDEQFLTEYEKAICNRVNILSEYMYATYRA